LIKHFKKASKVNVNFVQRGLGVIGTLGYNYKSVFNIFVNNFRIQIRKGVFVRKNCISIFYSFFHNLEKLKIKVNLHKEFFKRRFPISKVLIAPTLQKKQFFFRGLGGVSSYLQSFKNLQKFVKKNVPNYSIYGGDGTRSSFFLGGPFGSFVRLKDHSKYVSFLGIASRYLGLSRNLIRWLSTNKRSFFSLGPSFRSHFSLVNNSFFNFSILSSRSKQFLLRKINFFFRKRFFRKDILYGINRFILKSGWFDKVYKRRYGIKVKRYKDLRLAILNFFKNFVFLKIQNSVNNLFLTVVDMFGNTIGWMSLGAAGSKNAVKKTDYAVDVLATKFASKLRFFNIRNLHLHLTIKLSRKVKNVLKGFRKMRIRMNVATVNFITPHNGLRRSRRRRK
jgi:ribosomal protein S11